MLRLLISCSLHDFSLFIQLSLHYFGGPPDVREKTLHQVARLIFVKIAYIDFIGEAELICIVLIKSLWLLACTIL